MSKKKPIEHDSHGPAEPEQETVDPKEADPQQTTVHSAAADQLAAKLPGDDQESAVAESLQTLRMQLDEAKDRALRMQAELENYRKRVAREMAEERRYANLPLMRELLPVLDNMDRAVEAAEKTRDAEGLLEGVKMVAGQLEGVLQRYHCLKINALGEPFNPHLHEAISQQSSDEHPPGTVLQVTQPGFQLHDRVVRPSQVVVSAPEAQ